MENLSKWDIGIMVLSALTLIFGCIWCAMLFIGVEPDGFKDITLMFAGALISIATGKQISKGSKKKDNKKEEE